MSSHDRAIVLFHKVIEIEPRYAFAYFNLGKKYEAKGLYEKALEAYTKGAAISERLMLQERCLQQSGEIHLKQNNPSQAISYFEKAISLRKLPAYQKEKLAFMEMKLFSISEEASLFQDLGEAYFLSGKNKEAAAAFREASIRNPANAVPYQGLSAALLNAGDAQSALRVLQQAHQLAPENKNILENLQALQKSAQSSPANAS